MGKFFVQSSVGALGEELGCRYLRKKGYKIRETNYCNTTGRRLGEIDIIAERKKELVFVEVKTRLGGQGSDIIPEANITRTKLHKLERIALCYLREKRYESRPYHFDALAIIYDEDLKTAFIKHIDHIFL